MGTPTPKTPIVLNADGSVSMLVYQGRTLRLNATYEGLTSSTGYKARFGLTDKYGNALLASADSEDGTITFSDVHSTTPPNPVIATLIAVKIPDESMTIDAKSGKVDLVLEDPDGNEDPIMVGDWILWREVTP